MASGGQVFIRVFLVLKDYIELLPDYYLSLYDFFAGLGIGGEWLRFAVTATLWSVALLLDGIVCFLIAGPIAGYVRHFAMTKTKTKIDDVLLDRKLVRWFAGFVFCFILWRYLPSCSYYYPSVISLLRKVLNILAIGIFAGMLYKCVDVLDKNKAEFGDIANDLAPLKNILDVAIIGVASLLIVSIAIDRNIAYVVSGLGAMAAVLMFVFKDSLLGLIASIKLSVNKMLKLGDWIVVPQYGANGTVLEIKMSTIKIRNWDNSVTTIPPYSLLTSGFQSYANMNPETGRRLSRSIRIDATTVRYLSPEEVAEFIGEEWAEDLVPDTPYVNLTLFRCWLKHYVFSHGACLPKSASMFNANYEFSANNMVRELQPGPDGIPIEIYMLTTTTGWVDFEELQAELMDHVHASVSRFGLRVFQNPTGHDVRERNRIVTAMPVIGQ